MQNLVFGPDDTVVLVTIPRFELQREFDPEDYGLDNLVDAVSMVRLERQYLGGLSSKRVRCLVL